MELTKTFSYMRDKLISLRISQDFWKRSFDEYVIENSRILLLVIGICLLNTGLINISRAQYDPERTQAQNPEGVCCVAAFAQQTITLGPEQTITLAAEGSITIDNAEAAIAGTAEGAIDAAAEGANDLNPDPLRDEAPELAADEIAEPLEADYDDALNRFATGNILRFIEGAFGALVMVGAGLGAIVAAAFGAYKAAISLLFVAVGAFILRAVVSLFFGTNYPAYDLDFVGGQGV